MLIVPFVARLKYYFAWAVSEASLIFQGFNFNGFEADGKAKWDRYSNTRILQVEFCTSLAQLPVHWNTCTGNFLRRCELLPSYCRLCFTSALAPSPSFCIVLLLTQDEQRQQACQWLMRYDNVSSTRPSFCPTFGPSQSVPHPGQNSTHYKVC